MIKVNVKEISDSLRLSIKEKISALDITPGLCVIKVGHDPASETYVRNKRKACEAVGINFYLQELDEDISELEVVQNISKLNKSSDIHGILVQLPLPSHISESNIISAIAPEKDVDGFTTEQSGRLFTSIQNNSTLAPCTALGILDILKRITDIEGKNIVVVGRSNIVGKPTAALLLQENATVTVCHSKSKNLQDITSLADIVILATGKPKYFNYNFFDGSNPNLIIVDAGINYLDGKLCGDLDVESLDGKLHDSARYTSVPGGVGLMTVTELLFNVLRATSIIHNQDGISL